MIELLDGAYRLLACGTHPFSSRHGEITGADRYRQIADEYVWAAVRSLVCGLHVHVAVPGADRAATLTVRGRAGDASLPDGGPSAAFELARLLTRLQRYEPAPRVHPALEPLLDFLAPGLDGEDRVAQARAANPSLSLVIGALVTNVIGATVIHAPRPANVALEEATVTLACVALPGVDKNELEAELRQALGPGDYSLAVDEPEGGLLSPTETPLKAAIEEFLNEHDPQAQLIPALGYGYSDCHTMRAAYSSVVHGFIPFRHADPLVNLTSKHGVDERVLIDDLVFQTKAAISIARTIAAIDNDISAAA